MYQKFLALLCMAAFYAIYFSKQLAQRRQGVRTNQIGRGDKTAGTLLVERLLGAATLSIVPAEAASILLGGPAGPARFAAGLALCTQRLLWAAKQPPQAGMGARCVRCAACPAAANAEAAAPAPGG